MYFDRYFESRTQNEQINKNKRSNFAKKVKLYLLYLLKISVTDLSATII